MEERNKRMLDLVREMISRRYLSGNDEEGKLFRVLSVRDYLALHMIENAMREGADRIYLREIAGQMNLPMQAASSMVSALSSRGLLLWSHDGAGDEGTYVVIQDKGRELLDRQDEILRRFYTAVMERFGIDHLQELLLLLREFDEIVKDEKKYMTGMEEEGED